ncbi:MAG: hypothetical protein ABI587_08115 [Gemmatimonadales bacterium]
MIDRRLALATLLALAPASSLVAQNYREVPDDPGARNYAGLNLQLAFPQGEFKQFVGTGYGASGDVTFMLDRSGQAGLRIFLSWIEYGRTTQQVSFPSLPGLFVDLTTANDIFTLGVGPEFHLTRGALRPYVNGFFGLSMFTTTTSASGTSNSSPFAESENFNDVTFAYAGGGGLLFQVSHGRKPVFLDAGIRYQRHGTTRYLREGSIQTTPGGNVIINPIESKTDLLVVHAGVQFAF